VTDFLGHEAGERFVGALAARLRGAVDDGDVVARLGGDEFVVPLAGGADERRARALAGRVREAPPAEHALDPVLS
jgi:diguanylate cyclase (GGDEF)-like protein